MNRRTVLKGIAALPFLAVLSGRLPEVVEDGVWRGGQAMVPQMDTVTYGTPHPDGDGPYHPHRWIDEWQDGQMTWTEVSECDPKTGVRHVVYQSAVPVVPDRPSSRSRTNCPPPKEPRD